jgi:hypothetical protein
MSPSDEGIAFPFWQLKNDSSSQLVRWVAAEPVGLCTPLWCVQGCYPRGKVEARGALDNC